MGNNSGHEKMEKIGFKVIEVLAGSPGQTCGLIPNADFIISVDGRMLHEMVKGDILDLVKVTIFSNVSMSDDNVFKGFRRQNVKH